MEHVNIRHATEEHAALIADFSRQAFYDTFGPQNTKENMDKFLGEQFSREKLIKEVGAPGNIFLLAFDKEELLGYVRLLVNANHPVFDNKRAIEIARIYVSAHSIGKGIGKILMQECIRIAVEQQKEIIWLGVWEHNQRAIQFYEDWGFEKFGETIFLLGDDLQTDWLMKKQLAGTRSFFNP